jgi:hypothetical protein
MRPKPNKSRDRENNRLTISERAISKRDAGIKPSLLDAQGLRVMIPYAGQNTDSSACLSELKPSVIQESVPDINAMTNVTDFALGRWICPKPLNTLQ